MAAAVRARRKAERPKEILEAAFGEFSLHGYEAARLDDIAARAGVTKGTIYVYFENKERLFECLVTERGKEQVELLRAVMTDRQDLTVSDLRSDLVLLLRTLATDRRGQDLLRLLIAEAPRFPKLIDDHFECVFNPVLNHVRRQFVGAAERGLIRKAPALEHPELFLSPALLMHISRLLFADRWPSDDTSVIEAAVDLFLIGLAHPQLRADLLSGEP